MDNQPLLKRQRTPRRATFTVPSEHSRPKRIIVCCDGTWQDGLNSMPPTYSNIVKLSRMFKAYDDKEHHCIQQIVYYQAGVGTELNLLSEIYDGATGASLATKVQEAYGFIASNYQPNDEIFLFGFSRGAYTARMTAALIGEIGVLDADGMDHFADIFMAYQKKSKNVHDKKAAIEFLKKFNTPEAKGRIRADADGDTFTIRCLGVFDTVGALGIPGELRLQKRVRSLFGFPDTQLGEHIEHAFHAMALDETRLDFEVAKFEQSVYGKQKGQKLKQVWFSGSHSDVGGGWKDHDLADITLAWMVSNIAHLVAINFDYLYRPGQPLPELPWGTQPPHNPRQGIFRLAKCKPRIIPKCQCLDTRSAPATSASATTSTANSTSSSSSSSSSSRRSSLSTLVASLSKRSSQYGSSTFSNSHCTEVSCAHSTLESRDCLPPLPDRPTCESFHPSILKRSNLDPNLKRLMDNHPEMIDELRFFESELRSRWEKEKAKIKGAAQETAEKINTYSSSRFSFKGVRQTKLSGGIMKIILRHKKSTKSHVRQGSLRTL